jgi:acylpyruvate hydrolase
MPAALLTLRTAAGPIPALRVGELAVDARTAAVHAALCRAETAALRLPSTRWILEHGWWAQLSGAAETLAARGGEGVTALQGARLGPPVPDPEKVLCLGLNYFDHATEVGMAPPLQAPVIFGKWANALSGPADPIVLPAGCEQLDYEGELAAIVGTIARHVTEADALAHVAGYTVLNDVSARDLQLRTSQWTAGKAIDGFAPCGPFLIAAADIGDPQALRITTTVRGEVLQDALTATMMRPVARIVSELSALMTLRPGDVIATGTPAGVGMGRTPPRWLEPGDVVEVQIPGIGKIANEVIDAPA